MTDPGIEPQFDRQNAAAIEAIKTAKAQYCRYLDTKDWLAFRSLFADDFVSDATGAGGIVVVGADHFVNFLRKLTGPRPTVHHVHAPEIELTSATTARGVWALQDVVRFGFGANLVGYGHYDEIYEMNCGRWLIKNSRLTRVREDLSIGLFSIYLSPRLRKILLHLAGRAGS